MDHLRSFTIAFNVILASLLCLILIANAGCKKTVVVPPQRTPVKAPQARVVAPKQHLPSTEEIAQKYSAKIQIQYRQAAPKDSHRTIVNSCIAFLISEFGTPLYNGNIDLLITGTPGDNGRMTWTSKNLQKRSIVLHEFNLLKSERRVLVHELFHALYQTTAFINTVPEFVAEGLAVYAENKYRYAQMTNQQIQNKMQRQSLALDSHADVTPVDCDAPFSLYRGTAIDVIYLQAGRFIFSQFPYGTDTHKVRQMLSVDGGGRQWSFDQYVTTLGLVRNEPFLVGTQPMYSTPSPQKVN